MVHAEPSKDDAGRVLPIDIVELFGLCSLKDTSVISLFAVGALFLFAAIAKLLLAAIARFPQCVVLFDIDDCREERCRPHFMYSL